MTRLIDLTKKLNQLRQLDTEYQVFGSEVHHYESYPVSLVELEEFEQICGTRLPTEYREFLLEIGSGAGPYYGIWGPKQILEEYSDFEQQIGVTALPTKPFPFGYDEAQTIHRTQIECIEKNIYPPTIPHYEDLWTAGGCLVICTEGCTGFCVLITSGQLTGTVWGAEWMGNFYFPAFRPIGVNGRYERVKLSPLSIPASFYDWYNSWLEQAIADITA